ncbi:hypothetical protein ABZ479_40275 [Streptomyces sp. NPDC005722]
MTSQINESSSKPPQAFTTRCGNVYRIVEELRPHAQLRGLNAVGEYANCDSPAPPESGRRQLPLARVAAADHTEALLTYPTMLGLAAGGNSEMPNFDEQHALKQCRTTEAASEPDRAHSATGLRAELSDLADAVRMLMANAYSGCAEALCGADWDIVLTSYGEAGDRVVRWMDRFQVGGCGPVIANYERDALMWLVPPGTVHTWEHAHGLCFGGPFKVLLPRAGARIAPGPHWRTPPRLGHLVDADCLHHALNRFRPDLPRPVVRLNGTPALPGTPPLPLLPS